MSRKGHNGGINVGIYDIPASELIEAMAKDFEKEIEKPEFTEYVKTGASRERAPVRSDWWHIRLASILYRISKDGATGTESLRTYYGGKKNRGSKPHRFRKASGKIIRQALQELEKAGYLKKIKKGRDVTGKAQSFMLKKAKEVEKEAKENKAKKPVEKIKKSTEKSMEEKKVEEALKGDKPKQQKEGKKEKPEKNEQK